MKLRVIARIKKVLGTFLVLSLLFVTGFSFPREARAIICGFGSEIPGGLCQGFLTTNPGSGNQSWTVPSDWNNSNNTIECIGSGGNGGAGAQGGSGNSGGGGGAYAKISNLSLTQGGTATYAVGANATTTSAATRYRRRSNRRPAGRRCSGRWRRRG